MWANRLPFCALLILLPGAIPLLANTNEVSDAVDESAEYLQGQIAASADAERGVWRTYTSAMCILPGPTYGPWRELLQTKYGIEIDVRPSWDQSNAADWVRGYNTVSSREIKRHFGADIWKRASRRVAFEYWATRVFLVLLPLGVPIPLIWWRGRQGVRLAIWCFFVAAIIVDWTHFRLIKHVLLGAESPLGFWAASLGMGLVVWVIGWLYCRLLLWLRHGGLKNPFRTLWQFERTRWSS